MIDLTLPTNGYVFRKKRFSLCDKSSYSIAEDRSFQKLKQIAAFGPPSKPPDHVNTCCITSEGYVPF